jgi:endonuclease/exonuclease/phosphatase (EEP) superfamily protein YafD
MQFAVPLVAAAWWAGFVLKDGWGPTRLCFYVPPLAVAGLAAVWLAVYRRRASLLLRGFVAATLVASAVKVAAIDTKWRTPVEPAAGAIRLVQWNAAWGAFRPEAIWAALAKDEPDIVVFSEPPLRDFAERARRLIPDAHCHVGASMALVSRWPIEVRGSLVVPDVRSWHIRIATPAGPLDVLGVDIPSSPLHGRGRPLRDIARWVLDRADDAPLVVVGDFNTPRDSVFFEPLRTMLTQAYEVAGRGWPYSWPVPLPMWAIDQVWFSRGIRAARCEYRFAACSDHLREVVQFTIDRPAASGPADAAGR